MNASSLINNLRSRIKVDRFCEDLLRDTPRSMLAGLVCISLCLGFIAPGVSAKGTKRSAKPKTSTPTVTGIQFEKLVPASGVTSTGIPLSVQINGIGFGKSVVVSSVRVSLINQKSRVEMRGTVSLATDTAIIVRADAPINDDGSSVCDVDFSINGKTVDTSRYPISVTASATSTKPPSPSGARPFEITFDRIKTSNPQSLSIVTTNDEPAFAADPALMKVAILPAGATNITIEPAVTPQKMFVSFVAPDDFEVKDVVIAVFDANKNLIRYSGQPLPDKDDDGNIIAKEKPANDGIKIVSVDILSLQRRDGFGRLKIEGSGFGNYDDRTRINGDLELLCNPANRSYHVLERVDTNKDNSRNTVANKGLTAKVCENYQAGPNTWREGVERWLNVSLVPRNPDLRVERTLIMYANDKLIDVYFEFSYWKEFSEPFRLASVTVTVNKDITATAAVKSAHVRTDAPKVATKTLIASHDIGAPRNKDLEYRYTILDQKDASQLFGSGVGDNFYVIQLSVVNNGDKKLVIPLSAIQAEVEWAYKDDDDSVLYDEGPPTLSPLKLSAITNYFDAFQKTQGRKARIFNILDGVTTVAASLVPVFGRGLERGNSILNGGLIPGLHKAWGDLSSQQLQNLTGMSWDGVEEIPAGGSKEKFIYIQRSDQVFSNKDAQFTIHKTIKSLQGLEVSGFIVKESSAAAAVPKP